LRNRNWKRIVNENPETNYYKGKEPIPLSINKIDESQGSKNIKAETRKQEINPNYPFVLI
jgi:hypothetical protein